MKRIATLVVAVALAVLPSSALAQNSSTCQAYNPQTGCTVTQSSAATGTLPFTGLDAALLAVGGGGLLGVGLVLRRLSHHLN